MRLQVRTERLLDEGPLLDRLGGQVGSDHFALVREDEGLVAHGSALRVAVGTGPDRFQRAAEALEDLRTVASIRDEVGLPGTGLVAFGSFAFREDDDRSVLAVPRTVIGRNGRIMWRTTITPDGDPEPPPDAAPSPRPQDGAAGRPDRPRSAGSTVDDVAWLDAVSEAITAIRSGRLEKIVLARDQRLWARQPFDIARILARLATRHPSCFTFLVDGLLGASPELLLEVRAGAVRSEVLAGTVARGAAAAEDAAASAGLLASEKDRAEHEAAVASVRDVLREACLELHEDAAPHVLRLADVLHLATGLRGRLRPGVGGLEVLGALHPTAAVGGSPRTEALEAITRLEGLDRGRYAAPVGWFSADGDATWAIALRCAEVAGTRARLFAGAGVVAASLPEDELRETHLKLRAMQDALGA